MMSPEFDIVWTIGPFAIAANPDIIQTVHNDKTYRNLWRNILIRRKRSGVRLGKATKQDLDLMWQLFNEADVLLQNLPPAVDEIDEIIRLQELFDATAAARGRVLMGCEVMIDNCADPDLTYLDFKPSIREGLWLHKRLYWLVWLMNRLGIRPWSID